MLKHYVVTTRSDIQPGDVQIIGPFEDAGRAEHFGFRWQANNYDNPCWQVVTLPDGFVPQITAS